MISGWLIALSLLLSILLMIYVFTRPPRQNSYDYDFFDVIGDSCPSVKTWIGIIWFSLIALLIGIGINITMMMSGFGVIDTDTEFIVTAFGTVFIGIMYIVTIFGSLIFGLFFVNGVREAYNEWRKRE